MPAFGCPTPYAEPLWYSRDISPHYNESHRKLRAAVRKYIDEEIIPFAFEWEANGKVPDEVSECFLSFTTFYFLFGGGL
jgi:hypothetical protein